MAFDIMAPFEAASASLGVPSDQILLIFTFLVSIPLGFIQFYLVRGAFFRHIYSIVCGLSLCLLLYGPHGLINFAVSSSVVYLMLLVIPRNRVAVPVFVFSLGYLILSPHIPNSHRLHGLAHGRLKSADVNDLQGNTACLLVPRRRSREKNT